MRLSKHAISVMHAIMALGIVSLAIGRGVRRIHGSIDGRRWSSMLFVVLTSWNPDTFSQDSDSNQIIHIKKKRRNIRIRMNRIRMIRTSDRRIPIQMFRLFLSFSYSLCIFFSLLRCCVRISCLRKRMSWALVRIVVPVDVAGFFASFSFLDRHRRRYGQNQIPKFLGNLNNVGI
jgi:hypothetical protein